MSKPPLILLPGWGMPTSTLIPLAKKLREAGIPAKTRKIPGFDGNEAPSCLNEAVDRLLARFDEPVVLAGWSLGGVLASLAAAKAPEKVVGLVTLCTNACFVEQETWETAMDSGEFASFYDQVHNLPKIALTAFAGMCTFGAADQRGLYRQIKQEMGYEADWHYLDGLDWLAEAELMSAWNRYTQPRLHLFALADALVPWGAGQKLELEQHPVKALPGSHLLPYERPAAVAQELQAFYQQFQ